MKKLKKVIVVVTLLIGGMTFTGCEDGNATNNPQTDVDQNQSTLQTGEKTMDSKEKKAVLDSINMVNNRVDDLFTRIENQKSVIEKNQSDIGNLKKTSSISTLISWGIAIISIILAIYALTKIRSINARVGRHREDIERLKQSLTDMERSIVNNARNKNSGTSTFSNRDYTDLSYRISKLERLCTQLHAPNTFPIESGREKFPVPSQPQVSTLHGYFGLPSQMSMTEAYFKKFDEIRDSDSRFTVEIKDGKATFEPILESTKLLNGIKSGDVIKFALEFQGCALSDATQMRVKSAGEAIKKDGLWIITRKALIFLAQ